MLHKFRRRLTRTKTTRTIGAATPYTPPRPDTGSSSVHSIPGPVLRDLLIAAAREQEKEALDIWLRDLVPNWTLHQNYNAGTNNRGSAATPPLPAQPLKRTIWSKTTTQAAPRQPLATVPGFRSGVGSSSEEITTTSRTQEVPPYLALLPTVRHGKPFRCLSPSHSSSIFTSEPKLAHDSSLIRDVSMFPAMKSSNAAASFVAKLDALRSSLLREPQSFLNVLRGSASVRVSCNDFASQTSLKPASLDSQAFWDVALLQLPSTDTAGSTERLGLGPRRPRNATFVQPRDCRSAAGSCCVLRTHSTDTRRGTPSCCCRPHPGAATAAPSKWLRKESQLAAVSHLSPITCQSSSCHFFAATCQTGSRTSQTTPCSCLQLPRDFLPDIPALRARSPALVAHWLRGLPRKLRPPLWLLAEEHLQAPLVPNRHHQQQSISLNSAALFNALIRSDGAASVARSVAQTLLVNRGTDCPVFQGRCGWWIRVTPETVLHCRLQVPYLPDGLLWPLLGAVCDADCCCSSCMGVSGERCENEDHQTDCCCAERPAGFPASSGDAVFERRPGYRCSVCRLIANTAASLRFGDVVPSISPLTLWDTKYSRLDTADETSAQNPPPSQCFLPDRRVQCSGATDFSREAIAVRERIRRTRSVPHAVQAPRRTVLEAPARGARCDPLSRAAGSARESSSVQTKQQPPDEEEEDFLPSMELAEAMPPTPPSQSSGTDALLLAASSLPTPRPGSLPVVGASRYGIAESVIRDATSYQPSSYHVNSNGLNGTAALPPTRPSCQHSPGKHLVHSLRCTNGTPASILCGTIRLCTAFRIHRPDLPWSLQFCKVAAFLLMHYDKPEDAFALFRGILTNPALPLYDMTIILNNRGHARRRRRALVMLQLFQALLLKQLPLLFAHLKALELTPDYYLSSWLSSLFIEVLPYPTLTRAWDRILLGGEIFAFQIALGLLRYYELKLLTSGFEGCLRILNWSFINSAQRYNVCPRKLFGRASSHTCNNPCTASDVPRPSSPVLPPNLPSRSGESYTSAAPSAHAECFTKPRIGWEEKFLMAEFEHDRFWWCVNRSVIEPRSFYSWLDTAAALQEMTDMNCLLTASTAVSIDP